MKKNISKKKSTRYSNRRNTVRPSKYRNKYSKKTQIGGDGNSEDLIRTYTANDQFPEDSPVLEDVPDTISSEVKKNFRETPVKSKVLEPILNRTHTKSKQLTDDIKIQIFTDVDDTLHPAGPGVKGFFSGYDRDGDRDTYYQCVDELHKQIYEKFQLPTVIVSANPHSNKAKKKHIAKKLNIGEVDILPGEYIASGLSSINATLLGTGENNVPFVYTPMSNVKTKNIKAYVTKNKTKYPNYKAIWIGDNGQGDLLAAKELLEEKIIDIALIHYVNPHHISGLEIENRNEKLFSFHNYQQVIDILKNNVVELKFLENCKQEPTRTHHQIKHDIK